MSIEANLRVVFRADASLQMGTGHVMRCLTLADALAAKGADCQFICRAHAGHLGDFIRQKGYPVHLLDVAADLPEREAPLAHASWLGATQAQDAAETGARLAHLQPDWLVVDHYALDARWETLQRPYAGKLMVIDDLADRRHDCDLLLDQTFSRDEKDYKHLTPTDCRYLCGSQYVLLRREFLAARSNSLERRRTDKDINIIIAMGGVDHNNITEKVLRALQSVKHQPIRQINVILGITAPNLDKVKKAAGKMPWQTNVLIGINNVAAIMSKSNLAIAAAGSTTWELCCLGVPALLVLTAQNQSKVINALTSASAAVQIQLNELKPNNHAFNSAYGNIISELDKYSENSAAIIDGKGVERVCQEMAHSQQSKSTQIALQ